MNASVFSSLRIAAFSPWKRNFPHVLITRAVFSAFIEFNETYFGVCRLFG